MLEIDENVTPDMLLQDAEKAKKMFNQHLLGDRKGKGYRKEVKAPFLISITPLEGKENSPLSAVINLHPRMTIRQLIESIVKGNRKAAEQMKIDLNNKINEVEENVDSESLIEQIEKAESKK